MWKDIVWRIDRQNQSTGATCARDNKNKKEKERKDKEILQRQTGYLPRPPTSLDRNQILRGGSLQEISLMFVFHQNWLSGFQGVMGRNLPFPIIVAVSLCNSVYYRASRDVLIIVIKK